MTAATKGVYITLLCLMYEAEGPLPQRWPVLARRCGTSNSGFKRAIQDLLDEGKVEVLEDGLWSDKCEKHLATRANRVVSAKKAASVRWKKTQQKQQKNNADAMRSQCQPEPEPYIEEEPKGSLSSGDDAKPFDEVAEAVSLYNKAASESGWPSVRVLSKPRRSSLAARMKECGGLDGWVAALEKAQASPLCCGQNDRGWTANFDFLTRQSSFTKLMEGNYDARPNGKTNRPSADDICRAADAIARRL